VIFQTEEHTWRQERISHMVRRRQGLYFFHEIFTFLQDPLFCALLRHQLHTYNVRNNCFAL